MQLSLDYLPQPTDITTCPVCGLASTLDVMTEIPGLGWVDNACIEAEVKALVNTAPAPQHKELLAA